MAAASQARYSLSTATPRQPADHGATRPGRHPGTRQTAPVAGPGCCTDRHCLTGHQPAYAVTGLSPLLTDVRQTLGIGTAGATVIGMLPTLCFGAAGFLTPLIVRRLGTESAALIAVSIAALGGLVRPYVDSP